MNLLHLLPDHARPEIERPPEALGVPHEIASGEPKGNEINEKRVHLGPVGIKRPMLVRRFVDFRPWQRDQMRMLDIVHIQRSGKVDAFHERIVSLPEVAQNEIGLGNDADVCGLTNDIPDLLFGRILPHGIENTLASRLDPELNRMAARFLHELEDIQIGNKIHPTATGPGKGASGINHGMAEGFETLPIAREHIIIEEEIIHLVALIQFIEMVNQIGRTHVAEATSYHA